MAVYTQLSKAQIIRLLKKYDLGSLLNFKGIKDGIENTNYLVITTKGKLFYNL